LPLIADNHINALPSGGFYGSNLKLVPGEEHPSNLTTRALSDQFNSVRKGINVLQLCLIHPSPAFSHNDILFLIN
jgi:hypothetical protein